MSGGYLPVIAIIKYYKNYKDMYDEFEKKLFPTFSSDLTSLAWAFGEAETPEDKRWIINKNETNIKTGNFIKIWNNVMANKEITLTQIKMRDFLISNGFDLKYLMENFETGDKLLEFIKNLLNFNDNYLAAYRILFQKYRGSMKLDDYLPKIMQEGNYTRDSLYACKSVNELLDLYLKADINGMFEKKHENVNSVTISV